MSSSAVGETSSSARTRVLLVDDDIKLCRLVKEYLEPLGYEVSLAHSGPEGLRKAIEGKYGAVLLDVMLPGFDGFEVLKRLRAKSDVPVLMLTARGEPPDRIAGLDLGADDYLPKTFSTRELLARLRAVIRRSMVTAAQAQDARQAPFTVGELRVEPETRSASLGGKPLPLTPVEFDLLLALARDCRRIKTREQLLLEVAERDDWRLPNIKELQSLNDEHRTRPSIDTTCFPDATPSEYWSSTTLANHSTRAWTIDFDFGIGSYKERSERLRVRAVRGGIASAAAAAPGGPSDQPRGFPRRLDTPVGSSLLGERRTTSCPEAF